MLPLPPAPQAAAGRRALAAWVRERSLLAALSSLHRDLGEIFRLPLPGQKVVVLAGAEANRWVLVEQREALRWRMEGDPVEQLLGRGLLMQDGAAHDQLRQAIAPSLQRARFGGDVERMARQTDDVSAAWGQGETRDLLDEMRRLALLILMDALFGVDVRPDLERVWRPLLRVLDDISPGMWLVWPSVPRPGVGAARRQLHEYLQGLIDRRRGARERRGDVLDQLLDACGGDDGLVRDQLMTLLIAGHDTSTAHLAWTLYLLAAHPEAQARARAEVEVVLEGRLPTVPLLGQLVYLDRVLKESLLLYPPIPIGNRRAAVDLEFKGYAIPAGTRVLYSINLGHRDPRYWTAPEVFDPERFGPRCAAPPLAYVPFGGGPRFCVGAAFAQVEARVVLARLLQRFEFELVSPDVRPRLGATLEPRPGVRLRVRRRVRSRESK